MSQTDDGQWRLEVDGRVCIGSGLCVGMAPDHFELDDEGTSRPVAELTSPNESVVDAAEACPVEAIKVLDADTGTVVAPSS